MFSFITMNWRGRPLTSYRIVVQLIANTTTTGLTIQAELDSTVSDRRQDHRQAELAAVPLTPHDFHGDWNYTIHPAPLK